MQVVETNLADGIVSGINQLSCHIGMPKKLYIDIRLKLWKHHGTQFTVDGHNTLATWRGLSGQYRSRSRIQS